MFTREAITVGLAVTCISSAIASEGRVQAPDPPPPVPWSSSRTLAWSDFIAKPELGGRAAAETVYHLTYQESCSTGRLVFSVVSLFQPHRSWVKPSAIAVEEGRVRLLAHEQGHFDLSEVSARHLRRQILQLQDPCGMAATERKTIVQHLLREDNDAQARYDRDTAYGLDAPRQAEALLAISRQLASLAEFVDKSRPGIRP